MPHCERIASGLLWELYTDIDDKYEALTRAALKIPLSFSDLPHYVINFCYNVKYISMTSIDMGRSGNFSITFPGVFGDMNHIQISTSKY